MEPVTHFLINDYINEMVVERFEKEVRGRNRLCLLIHSIGGSVIYLDIMLKILQEVEDSTAVVFEANSAPATLALFCKRRMLAGQGMFRLHTGSVNVDECKLGSDNTVPDNIISIVKSYKENLLHRLAELGLPNSDLNKLSATGWLQKTKEEWVKSGLFELG
jgi:hypothetical protein